MSFHSFREQRYLHLVAGVLWGGVLTVQSPAAPAGGDPVVLKNGITVLMHPVPEADRIAVEAIYGVGFIHEPKGMTQAAHLLEHLACNAASESYKPGAAMALLNRKGMANAETLASWTHYDYMLPASELELILRIEAERLSSLEITKEMVRQEAPRCYQETDFVERNPRAGMFKHAFMAFNQVWRHGGSEALVRGGMEEFSIKKLKRFHRAHYRPDNLLLVIVGRFDEDDALTLVRKHLGHIKSGRSKKTKTIDWSKVPRKSIVRWDSEVRAVCIGFPPPNDQTDRLLLSVWGGTMLQRLMADPEANTVADAVFCTNQLLPVGELPFFFYATAKPNADLDDVEAWLSERLRSFVAEKPEQMLLMQLRMFTAQLVNVTGQMNWAEIRRAAKMLQAQGRDPKEASTMVMGQMALNWGVAYLLLGPDPSGHTEALERMTADRLHRILRRNLDQEKAFTTMLIQR